MNEYADSMVFPLDGEDTTDTVSITFDSTGEVIRFPRLWQMPDGVIDLSVTLQGMIDQREDAMRQWEQVGAYYGARQAFAHGVRSKLEALNAAAEAQDEKQVERLLASFTPAEYADIGETVEGLLDKHPEWALAPDGDDE